MQNNSTKCPAPYIGVYECAISVRYIITIKELN